MKKWQIIGLIILTAGALIGWLIYSNFLDSSSSDTSSTQVIETTAGQVSLIKLNVSTNSPVVGENLKINLNLDQVTNPLSAISIKLTLPLDSADQFAWQAEPFTISQTLQDAGWQILVNQIEASETELKAELALGQLSVQDTTSSDLLFDQNFAQLNLVAQQPVSSGEIVIDTLISKIVTKDGDTLPLQVMCGRYSVREETL